MRFLKHCIFIVIVASILYGIACAETDSIVSAESESPVLVEMTAAPAEEVVSVLPDEAEPDVVEPEVTEESAAATAEPATTAEPVPTREPREGDITDHFPNYDTGTDADYSYQSDELRIAIKKYVNPHDPEIPEVYYVADIWMRNINSFRTGFAHGKYNSGREDGEQFAEREHAILAVNGTMNTGLVLRNGTWYKSTATADLSFFDGVMLLYEDGSMKTFNVLHNHLDLDQEQKKKAVVQAWHFGPVLLQDGKVAQQFNLKGTRHPRIMLGYYEPGHYVVVAVDGRNSKRAIGMNEYEMAELMKELGCREALNLDGGTSAMMVFMGKCISTPSGVDLDGDGKAGRELADMLLFAEYDSYGNAPELSEIEPSRLKLGDID